MNVRVGNIDLTGLSSLIDGIHECKKVRRLLLSRNSLSTLSDTADTMRLDVDSKADCFCLQRRGSLRSVPHPSSNN